MSKTKPIYIKFEKKSDLKPNYHLTVIIDGKEDLYSFLKGHEVIDLIKVLEK